jgi:lipopolysaccharide transport system ATP-binding protein
MYVRLAFAVAAHLEPEILVVDEVLAVGDMAFQEKCIGKMGEVSRQGRTVLFVSHNLQSVWSLCPKSIWMEHGKIREYGTSSEVIERYRASQKEHLNLTFDVAKRIGTGRVTVRDLYFAGTDENRCYSLTAGADAKIILRLTADRELAQSKILIHVVVINDRQMRLMTFSNEFSGDDIGKVGDSSIVTCTIQKLPLIAGEYDLLVSVRIGSELLDKFLSPHRMVVSEGDFYGTRRMPDKSLGEVLAKHRWEVKEEGEY